MELIHKGGAAPQKSRSFDGRFFFTNPDTEDFTGIWNGTAYNFPARKTSPFYVVDANPIETQEIRKRFALKLAQRMFGKSDAYRELEKKSEGKISPMFYDSARELQPYVDMCLSELPESEVQIKKTKKEEPSLKIDPKTKKPVVRVMGESDNGSTSLIEEAQNIVE